VLARDENQAIRIKKSPKTVNELLGEIITNRLSRPTSLDIYSLVILLASEKSKTLMEILLEQESQQVSKEDN
jgi:hypothetical protein